MIQVLVGLGCAALFLVVALHGVPLEHVAMTLTRASLCWLLAAIFAYGVNLALRAWRWQMILRPVAAVSYPAIARILLVGYGLNTIMPLRLGELFRAEYLKRTFGLARVPALVSIVVERLLDGRVVVVCLGAGVLLAAPNQKLADLLLGALATGGAVFGMISAVALGLGKVRLAGLLARFPCLAKHLAAASRGFPILRTWRTVPIVLLTLVIYLPEGLTLWCLVRSVGLSLGPANTAVLVGAASLSTLLPSGPAFLGTLQFAYVLAIEFAGASGAIGVAAATLAQFCVLVPVSAIAMAILFHDSGRLLRAAWRANAIRASTGLFRLKRQYFQIGVTHE